MKTEIYTIPIQDAFAEESECPVCRMYQKLEENAINYTIGPGASYMEGDIRGQNAMNRASVRNIWKCYMNIRIN